MRTPLLGLAALLAFPIAASGHELEAHVSASGVEFVEAQIPSFIPETMSGLEMEKDILDCGGGDSLTVHQRNTALNIEIHQLDLALPDDDKMRVDILLSMSGDGELFIDNAYACFGETTCNDDFYLRRAQATVEFNIEVVDGKPQVKIYDLELDVDSNSVGFELSGCALDGLGNWVVDFGRDYLLDVGLDMVRDLADDQIAPMLNEMLIGFNGYQASIDTFRVNAQLSEVDILIDGIKVAGNLDISSRHRASNCIKNDPGEPKTHEGQRPTMNMNDADIGVVANYGLIDDALYHAWRRGMMCFTDSKLAELGLDTKIIEHEVEKILPGFPPGTKISMELGMQAPPRVQGSAAGGLIVVVEGLTVDILGLRPDGKASELNLELDLSLEAKLAINPHNNTLALEFGESSVNRLAVENELGSSKIGLDAARLRMVLGDHIMPGMLKEMSGVPMMSPIVGVEGFYLILREAEMSQAFMAVKADLFRAPTNDNGAPDTTITDKPTSMSNPKTALLKFTGTDDLVPQELLQYQVTVDGEARAPDFMRQALIGEAGISKSYQVEVAAVDLGGNIDPSPATVELFVDGVRPGLAIRGDRVREADGTSHELEWTVKDDMSDVGSIATRIEQYRVNNPNDALSKQLIDTQEFAGGVTRATVPIRDGDLYRVEVIAIDEAGNESRTALTLSTPGLNGCACSSSGGVGGATPVALGLAFALIALRRRRRLQVARK